MHALGSDKAVLSVQSVLDQFVLWVQVVEDHIGVAGVTGCEDNDFEIGSQSLEHFNSMWANIDPSLNDLPCREGDGQRDIMWRRSCFVAMDKCLIQVEHHRLLA